MRFEIRNKLVFLCALFSLSWLFFTSSHVTNFSAVYFPFPSIGLFTLAMFCVCVCVLFFVSFSLILIWNSFCMRKISWVLIIVISEVTFNGDNMHIRREREKMSACFRSYKQRRHCSTSIDWLQRVFFILKLVYSLFLRAKLSASHFLLIWTESVFSRVCVPWLVIHGWIDRALKTGTISFLQNTLSSFFPFSQLIKFKSTLTSKFINIQIHTSSKIISPFYSI